MKENRNPAAIHGLLRYGITAGSFVLVIVVIYLLHPIGVEILYISLVPAIISGIYFRIIGGFIGGVLSSILFGFLLRAFFEKSETYSLSLEVLDAAVTVALGVSMGYIMKLFGKKNELIRQLKQSLREREVLLQEVHHRIKNNLNLVTSLIKLRSRDVNNDSAKSFLEETYQRIKSIGLIHELLYRSKDLSRVSARHFIEKLVSNLLDSYQRNEDQIELSLNIDDVCMDLDTGISCGLLINELVVNTLKHAFPNGEKGKVCIALHTEDEKSTLIIQDNGVGMSEDHAAKSPQTLGLRIVNALVEQLRGTIELVNGGSGTTFRITFEKNI